MAVPPSATARSVMPVIEPPVITTSLASCKAIVPSPSVLLTADVAWVAQVVPLATIKRSEVVAKPAMSSKPWPYDNMSVPIVNPRLSLAWAVVVAPVPPYAMPRVVVPQVPPSMNGKPVMADVFQPVPPRAGVKWVVPMLVQAYWLRSSSTIKSIELEASLYVIVINSCVSDVDATRAPA